MGAGGIAAARSDGARPVNHSIHEELALAFIQANGEDGLRLQVRTKAGATYVYPLDRGRSLRLLHDLTEALARQWDGAEARSRKPEARGVGAA